MTAVESRLAATLAKHSLQDYQPAGSWSPSPGESWVWCACGVAITADGSPAQLHAAHVAAVIASADDLAVIAKPDAKNPTPALIEAAYIAQDDLSKPPEPWLIELTAEIIDAYVDAQGHDAVHVIGHDAAVRAAKAAEGVSDR